MDIDDDFYNDDREYTCQECGYPDGFHEPFCPADPKYQRPNIDYEMER